MLSFEENLAHEIRTLQEAGLWRELRGVDSSQGRNIILEGRSLLNFSSNDYLGLANAPELKEAAAKALAEFGAGSGASRLICGSLKPHQELESGLAEFKGTEAALTFSSGYSCALGTIQAAIGQNDVSVIDKRVHASIVDGVRLSGAKIRVFKHNDLNSLAAILAWADAQKAKKAGRVLIITESIFSMEGDRAPLREIIELKEKHGAWLMVDEAHATGLYGRQRRGVIEEYGLGSRVEIQMGTLGKAFGAAGGYIVGSRNLIDFLVNKARSFIFSTAPPPAAATAALAGVNMVRSSEGKRRCDLLWDRAREVRASLPAICSVAPELSAIIPIIIGCEKAALAASVELREQGIFIPAIRYPTVAKGTARLRLTLTAEHTKEDLTTLFSSLRGLLEKGNQNL